MNRISWNLSIQSPPSEGPTTDDLILPEGSGCPPEYSSGCISHIPPGTGEMNARKGKNWHLILKMFHFHESKTSQTIVLGLQDIS